MEFRSKLEKFCYDELEKNNIQFEYEPYRFVLLESFHCDNDSIERVGKKKVFKQPSRVVRKITYLPDFVGDDWIIETKGYEKQESRIKWKMFKKYLLDNDLTNIKLYKPHTKKEVRDCIKDLLASKKVNNDSNNVKSNKWYEKYNGIKKAN